MRMQYVFVTFRQLEADDRCQMSVIRMSPRQQTTSQISTANDVTTSWTDTAGDCTCTLLITRPGFCH